MVEGKLNYAKKAATRLEDQATTLREQLAQLEERLGDARAAVETAEAEVDSLCVSLATAPTSSGAGSKLDGLLQQLGSFLNALSAESVALPESVSTAVCSLQKEHAEANVRVPPPESPLEQPLETVVRRRFGPRRQWPTPSEASDNDQDVDSDLERVKQEDVEMERARVKRKLDLPASWAECKTEELKRRLCLCRDDLAQALETERYTAANTLNGVIHDLTQELSRRAD